ncbi:unnamed protein product [Arabidopsis lyrata]|uniref:Predicted protein n=1 Tax=Arabidopsis lyrata subsp. lyrata TaxID=81972 RepID=D7LDV1_ARALL|nr:predicted protein [Arabidopsis lyrata subsp. lyrata]CAH8266110.1 unnamed protein product [Arabidopsis lyrata]
MTDLYFVSTTATHAKACIGVTLILFGSQNMICDFSSIFTLFTIFVKWQFILYTRSLISSIACHFVNFQLNKLCVMLLQIHFTI